MRIERDRGKHKLGSIGSRLGQVDAGASLERDLDIAMYQDAKNRMNTFEVWSRKRLGEIRQRIEELEK